MKGYGFKGFKSFGKLARVAVWWLAGASLFPMSAGAQNPPLPWDTFSDTWVATDGLGRTVPGFEQVGAPKAGKTVGFSTSSGWARAATPGRMMCRKFWNKTPRRSRTPIVRSGATVRAAPLGRVHFRVLPEQRRGAPGQTRTDALGCRVEVVVFDVTNQLTYPRSYTALGKVFERVVNRGDGHPRWRSCVPSGVRRKW
jgi:hypothetical protein